MTLGLLGSNGTIGQSILNAMPVDHVYNSLSANPAPVDHLIVAAPSGNRLAVNRGLIDDIAAVDNVITLAQQIAPKRITLISTVDVVVAPDTVYGANRARLEAELSARFRTTVLRLSTLIGPNIKKNILFDIKHNSFLSHVNPDAVLQWCLLGDLPSLISNTELGTVLNVVSEPISNKDVLKIFCPELNTNSGTEIVYNQTPYIYTQQQILDAMREYLT